MQHGRSKTAKPTISLRVEKGCLMPADSYASQQLRERGYRVGDIVAGDLRKPRNPAFHRLAHQIGALAAANIEAFSGMNCHAVLKRIQIEANIGCDEVALRFPGVGPCTYRVPRSLAFESMEEGEFRTVIAQICAHLAKEYWPTLSPDQVEQMAETWVEEA